MFLWLNRDSSRQVHLVIDRKYRSENRRALTVQSPSEIGSSSSGTEGSLSFEVFDMERGSNDIVGLLL